LPIVHIDQRMRRRTGEIITVAEQRLEGPINDAVIQEFTEQEVVAQQQVEASRAKIKAFETELPIPE
jgi:hypothetical protein